MLLILNSSCVKNLSDCGSSRKKIKNIIDFAKNLAISALIKKGHILYFDASLQAINHNLLL